MRNAECRVQNAECRVQNAKCGVNGRFPLSAFRFRLSAFRLPSSDFGGSLALSVSRLLKNACSDRIHAVFARKNPMNRVTTNNFQRAVGGLVLAVAAMSGQTLSAQDQLPDKVILRSEDGSGRTTLSCRIVDYTGEAISIERKPRGRVLRYRASQVVEVQTPQTAAHVRALQDFKANRIEQARAGFEDALPEEERRWVRREILAMLVRCALHRGDYGLAGSRFLFLVRSDPHTRHFKLIPLVWAPHEMTADLQNEARAWLAGSSEAVRLIGASLLLGGAAHGKAAQSELDQLATSADPRVRQLARAQRWRLELRAEDPSKLDIERWQSDIEEMPEDLRGGPYYVLGRAYLRRFRPDLAAMALLWLPLVYDHDRYLAARACLEAADALSRHGQKTEATNLYREVTTRFRDTPYAQEAASVLKNSSQEVHE